ncbi:MAG TPA: lysine--tRNA ligase [Pyrinomonadaceae bacterium]|jgi:lysyl-tRNA synthetase class 2|nr:lysine--tRNA ligase [Pyrinomonadaceae bacterium]
MSTKLPEDIIPDNDQTRARASHLEEIEALVGNAYPNKFRRTNLAGSIEGEDTVTALASRETIKKIVGDERFAEAFTLLMSKVKAGARPTAEELEPVNARLGDINVRVSGRLATPPRVMGKVAFVHLSDGRERLQIYVKKQDAVAVSNDSGQPVEEDESGWKLFGLLDHGDFVGVEGFLFVTKTGELSVHVRELQFLSKALVPMPDKMHGIADPEIRQRRRYADLIASSLKVEAGDEQGEGEAAPRELSTREVFERRSKLVTAMRRHLDDNGYIEVETPMLSPIASGAAARPFKTHHNALDIDLYLRIAPELYLKRLLVGGFERVYELNRNFRNEGISTRHNPEFTMLEFYTAYKDVSWMMDFCEEMIRQATQSVAHGRIIPFANIEINFGIEFRRLTMKEAIAEYWPPYLSKLETEKGRMEEFEPAWLDDQVKVRALKELVDWAVPLPRQGEIFTEASVSEEGHAETERLVRVTEDFSPDPNKIYHEVIVHPSPIFQAVSMNWQAAVNEAQGITYQNEDEAAEANAKAVAAIFETVAEKNLIQPTFIKNFPKVVSPLSKASPDNPAIAERFELYVAGMEVANGFSELNDPAEQLERFEDQARQRERGDDEAMQMDLDYVRALSYGMPPAAGIGIGIDRLTMLLTNRRSIRDVILFPHMRPRQAAEEQSPAREEEAEARAEEAGGSDEGDAATA